MRSARSLYLNGTAWAVPDHYSYGTLIQGRLVDVQSGTPTQDRRAVSVPYIDLELPTFVKKSNLNEEEQDFQGTIMGNSGKLSLYHSIVAMRIN